MFLLNGNQQKALEELDRFISSKCQRIHLLEGFAGTGKTTVITSLISSKKFFKKDVVLSATTNKAVSVLKTMFKHKPDHIEFKTIHKLCKIKRRIDYNGDIQFNLSESPQSYKEKQKSIFNYDIIIIDECSMISAKILELIVSLSYKIKGKIIFVGDRYQLPPVNETMSEVFSLPVNKSVLLKIVRCNDNTIKFAKKIRESIDTKSNISTKHCKGDNFIVKKDSLSWIDGFITNFNLSLNNVLLAYTNKRCDEINRYIRKTIYGDKSRQTYVDNEMIVFNNFYKISDISLQEVEPGLMAIVPIQDSEHVRDASMNGSVFYTSSKAIITSCNRITLKIPMFPIHSLFNISKKLDMNFTNIKPEHFEEDKNCPICFDEIKHSDAIETGCNHIFCRKCIKIWLEENDLCPYCRMKISEKQIIFNDDERLTELVNDFINKSHNQVYNVWVLDVKDNLKKGTIYVVTESDRERLNKTISELKKSIIEIKNYLSKKANISTRKLFIVTRLWEYFYYSFIDIFADISYGYCITIHKSQGSTFDDVYLDCKNILHFNKSDSLNCLYTGVTRASKTLTILI